jgi:hypothetical protein
MNQQSLPSHNPAECLLLILTELANSPKNKTILKVFSEVLDINEEPTSFFGQGLIPILLLIDSIKKEIENFPSKTLNYF